MEIKTFETRKNRTVYYVEMEDRTKYFLTPNMKGLTVDKLSAKNWSYCDKYVEELTTKEYMIYLKLRSLHPAD